MAHDHEVVNVDERRPTPVQVAEYGATDNAEDDSNTPTTKVSFSSPQWPHRSPDQSPP